MSTVFASRWKALAWSGGVLLTAYCSVPSNDEGGADSAVVNPAVAVVTGLLGGGAPAAQADSHVSPWAMSPRPVPTPTPGQ